jgi:hypothetical protein
MKKADVTSQTTYQPIPFPVVIGVTGHRKLTNESELAQRVNEAICQIRKMLPPLPSTPVVLCVLSPLAEGADRLVARQVLGLPGSELEVVLPLQREDYVKDFEAKESRAEFERLLSVARRVRQLEPRKTRNESYEQVGHYIVDRCDALIALWDGQPSRGQGGTADIVQYARDKQCPLFWINTNHPFAVTFEPGAGLSQLPLAEMENYNNAQVDDEELQIRKAKEQDRLMVIAEKTAASVRASLRTRLGELEVLCLNPLLFHSKVTFDVVDSLKEKLTYFFGLLEGDGQIALSFWRNEVSREMKLALTAIFQESERLEANV